MKAQKSVIAGSRVWERNSEIAAKDFVRKFSSSRLGEEEGGVGYSDLASQCVAQQEIELS